jgi:hypothetical protein
MILELNHPQHDVTEIGCHCCSDYAQARLTIKQVVEMFDKVHLKPSGEANLALEYAAIVAGLREMVK